MYTLEDVEKIVDEYNEIKRKMKVIERSLINVCRECNEDSCKGCHVRVSLNKLIEE